MPLAKLCMKLIFSKFKEVFLKMGWDIDGNPLSTFPKYYFMGKLKMEIKNKLQYLFRIWLKYESEVDILNSIKFDIHDFIPLHNHLFPSIEFTFEIYNRE